MHTLLKSMSYPRTVLSVVILASGVICLPISGHGRQVAVAFGSASSLPDNATATAQAQGGSKSFGDASTLAAVPRTGNGAQQSQHSVNLTWKASPSAGAKYNVYRSATKGECLKPRSDACKKMNLSPMPGTNYTDSAVQAGQNYFYVIRSVNLSGKESNSSNEAQAAVSPPKP
jgi:hypothetical protein